MLYLDGRRTIVKRSELGKRLLTAMLKQLGIDKQKS